MKIMTLKGTFTRGEKHPPEREQMTMTHPMSSTQMGANKPNKAVHGKICSGGSLSSSKQNWPFISEHLV